MKLFKGTNVGCLQQVDNEINDLIMDSGGNEHANQSENDLHFDLEHLKPKEKEQIEVLLRENPALFAKNLSELG